jgi:hypothetical protein
MMPEDWYAHNVVHPNKFIVISGYVRNLGMQEEIEDEHLLLMLVEKDKERTFRRVQVSDPILAGKWWSTEPERELILLA